MTYRPTPKAVALGLLAAGEYWIVGRHLTVKDWVHVESIADGHGYTVSRVWLEPAK